MHLDQGHYTFSKIPVDQDKHEHLFQNSMQVTVPISMLVSHGQMNKIYSGVIIYNQVKESRKSYFMAKQVQIRLFCPYSIADKQVKEQKQIFQNSTLVTLQISMSTYLGTFFSKLLRADQQVKVIKNVFFVAHLKQIKIYIKKRSNRFQKFYFSIVQISRSRIVSISLLKFTRISVQRDSEGREIYC